MPSRSSFVNTEIQTRPYRRAVDPGNPSTWPDPRLHAAQHAMTRAAAVLFLSASEFDQVTALRGLPAGTIDDVLTLARLAAAERRQIGGVA